MKLYLSRFKYMDNAPNVLKLGFLKSPDKNLIVLNCRERILSFYILSDKNPGPIKFQLENKSRLLVFSEVSRFECKVDKKYHYTQVYYANKFEEAISKVVGNRSGILSRWRSNEDYLPMCVEDNDKVAKFYEALEIERP